MVENQNPEPETSHEVREGRELNKEVASCAGDVSPHNTDCLEKLPSRVLDDPTLFPEGGKKANLVLLGSFFGLIGMLAFVNSIGVMENYIKAHILPDEETSSVAWIFALYNFMSFGMTIVLGAVFDRLGVRPPIMFGIVLIALGIMCMSVSTKLYQFILSFGVVAGLGNAFVFAPFVSVLSHYFYRRRGRAVGFAYIGGAIGGVATPLIFLHLYPKVGFGWAIRIIGFICLTLLILGLILVEDRRHVFNKNIGSNKSIVKDVFKSIDITVFKDKTFSMLALALLGNGFAFTITLTYLSSYAVAAGLESGKSYLLLTVFNAFSIPGRLFPGYMADQIGNFNTLCIMTFASSVAFFVVWLPHPIGHSIVGLFIFAGLYGFTLGSLLSLTPTCIGVISKTKDFGKRSGTAFFVLSIADLFGLVIGGAIIADGSLKYFDHLVIFVSLCAICGTVGAWVSRYFYVGLKLVKA